VKARDTNEIGRPELLNLHVKDIAPPPKHYVAQSGGIFKDMCCHDFNLARWLVGSEITSVFARGANLVEPYIKEAGDFDTVSINLAFENGALGNI